MIYNSFFGFATEPFGVTPDPRFLFLSKAHEEALAHLKYGIMNERGFIMLTGEVGSGKTTLMRHLIGSLNEKIHTSVILNPKAEPYDLLKMIASDFGISCEALNQTDLLKYLNEFLVNAFQEKEKAVIFIDEAQDMSRESLEFIRLLTNLETDSKKLVQVVLIGQPELREIISEKSLRQLDQRIVVRYHIGPLKKDEIGAYIKHRLMSAGSMMTFPERVNIKIYRYSNGIPRLINRACDRILLNAYAEGRKSIDKAIVNRAFKELSESKGLRTFRVNSIIAACGGIAITLAVFLALPNILDDIKKTKPHRTGLSIDQEGLFTTEDPAMSRTASLLSLMKIWGENDIKLSSYKADDLINEKGYSLYKVQSLDDLKLLDLPAMLIYNGTKKSRHKLLVWILGDDAVIFNPMEGKTLTPLADLRKDLAEIVILWKNKYNNSGRLSLMQKRLSEIGFLSEYTAGVIDIKTTEALKRFQAAKHIHVTGRPDEKTLMLLSKDINSPKLYPDEFRHGNTRQNGKNRITPGG